MKKHILYVLILLISYASNAQQNATLAKIEFQMAEEAYDKKQYAIARDHIKKAEELLKQQNPKTRYLDILAQTELMGIKTFTFENSISKINSQMTQLGLYVDGTNSYIQKYASIVPEVKIKEIYQLNILGKKTSETGNKLLEVLYKHRAYLMDQYQNYTVDSNKNHSTILTQRVNNLIEMFRPGSLFSEALGEINHPKPSEFKSKMKAIINIVKNPVGIQPQTQHVTQALSPQFNDFLKRFNNQKAENFLYPITNLISGENLNMGGYTYKHIPLTFEKVRSTNLASLKFDKEIKLDQFKVSPSINRVYVGENDVIVAVYLSFPYYSNLEKEFLAWMGEKSHRFLFVNYAEKNEKVYDWYYNDLTVRFGYSLYDPSKKAIPTSYVLITHADKNLSIINKSDLYMYDNKFYYIEF